MVKNMIGLAPGQTTTPSASQGMLRSAFQMSAIVFRNSGRPAEGP
jgi:hypothetical protein